MSGICTTNPVALIRTRHGIDMETYQSELDCVLHLVDNGTLGRGINPKAIGWGSADHKAALKMVEEKLKQVRANIDEEDRREAMASAIKMAAEGGAA